MGHGRNIAKNEILVALGRRIRVLRNGQGLSQAQLADSAGMSSRYLSEVEAGKRNISIERLEMLANRLSVTLTELLNFEKPGTREDVLHQIIGALTELPLEKLLFIQRALRMYRNK